MRPARYVWLGSAIECAIAIAAVLGVGAVAEYIVMNGLPRIVVDLLALVGLVG